MHSIEIIPLILMMLIVAIVYNLLKIFVLPRVKINKWIVLLGTIATLIGPQFSVQLRTGIFSYLFIGVSVILFLWFMDLAGWGPEGIAKRKMQKQEVVIKAKAKPNRIKHMNEKEKENVIIKSKKKKHR